ncbi:MAG: class I SAM-dependent methyltransferase [Zoogloeaceae bacterium]|nr:class I SAM-dependent methyltransferase [Zoogloeaceae bacterium]
MSVAVERDVKTLGQVFTPPEVVDFMLKLRLRKGRTLEPSAGAGAFFNALRVKNADCVGIELDGRIAPEGVCVMDFFAYPETERFDAIIGNPPYVRFQDILPETRARLSMRLFDGRSNLFLFFIEKCVRHLNPGGELIFIVPRELAKLTAARKLNAWLFQEGSITDFLETGDRNLFGDYVPNCVIFRFEKGLQNREMRDGRRFCEVRGQWMFLSRNTQDYPLSLADVFEVKVGGVSGADGIFVHSEGALDVVYSRTAETGKTRRMFYDQPQHPHLVAHKQILLKRKVRPFDESNWWQWGRKLSQSRLPRIYVNGKTRRPVPFFLHDCPYFDGAILALFPRRKCVRKKELEEMTRLLNEAVDWEEQGFVCDGRFLFTQRTLQHCHLPEVFRSFVPDRIVECVP